LSDIVIRPLREAAELRACVELQQRTWGPGFSEAVPPAILWVTQQVGGVAAGAFTGDTLVGFVFGLTGVRDGELVHWSDMLAVAPEHRDRGIGVRLKAWQRERLLPLGVRRILWTFDPLEARNAHVNFGRLGVTAREYLRDVYGTSDSPLHQGIGTDRLLVEWEIGSPRVERALSGAAAVDDGHAAVPLVNETVAGAAGPETGEPRLDLETPAVRIAVPAAIQELKRYAPRRAVEWRGATRRAFEAYLGRGYRVVGVLREDGRSCYVLTR